MGIPNSADVRVQSALNSLRDKICDVAIAHSSGLCTQDYLDRTRYSADQVKFPPVIDWCAFYAAWVWRQAGVGVYFRTSPMKMPPAGICRVDGDRQVAASVKLHFLNPGDIILFDYIPPPPPPDPHKKPRTITNHHAIVTSVQGSIIDMVEGNWGDKYHHNHPDKAPVYYARNYDLSTNTDTKAFYSVQTFLEPNVRFM
jgi:hypothetical protein